MGEWIAEAMLFTIFVVPVIVLFGYAVYDVIRRHDSNVVMKAVWLIAFCVLPIVGPLVYLVIRPPGTTAQEEALAAGGRSRADELTALADLHDRGKLTDREYEHIKSQHVFEDYGMPSSVREQRGSQML